MKSESLESSHYVPQLAFIYSSGRNLGALYKITCLEMYVRGILYYFKNAFIFYYSTMTLLESINNLELDR